VRVSPSVISSGVNIVNAITDLLDGIAPASDGPRLVTRLLAGRHIAIISVTQKIHLGRLGSSREMTERGRLSQAKKGEAKVEDEMGVTREEVGVRGINRLEDVLGVTERCSRVLPNVVDFV
jgi:hypothetical protein